MKRSADQITGLSNCSPAALLFSRPGLTAHLRALILCLVCGGICACQTTPDSDAAQSERELKSWQAHVQRVTGYGGDYDAATERQGLRTHKTGAPLYIDFNFQSIPQAGEPLELLLQPVTSLTSGTLQLSISGSQGLRVLSAQKSYQFDLSNAEIPPIEVQVLSDLPGKRYLKLMSSLDSGGVRFSRGSSVVIEFRQTSEESEAVTEKVENAAVQQAPDSANDTTPGDHSSDDSFIDATGERIIILQ